ncbi:MAG: HEAT repeat domain-containing protein [Phycisphaerales bacterium]|jgi:HEAT repeat protein|nr:HEAT repeat domain-containing protein [Phycisphaerales bacterium]
MNLSKQNRTPASQRCPAGTLLLITALLACCANQARGADAVQTAQNYLAKTLVDQKNAYVAINAFHAADDQELTPLFVALSRSGDKKKRLLASRALGQLANKDAIAALKYQLSNDSVMAVRSEAIVRLLDLQAADAELLSLAAKIKDESIQCIAARSLAKISKDSNHTIQARSTLQKLTASTDAMTAAMASQGLLAMGDSSQLDRLKKIVTDPKTNPAIVRVLMLQIIDEKISVAKPLTQAVIASPKQTTQIRIMACKALSAAGENTEAEIFAALRASGSMIYRVPVLGILASLKNSGPYVGAIAKSSLPIAPLAGLEMARKTPGAAASSAVDKALAMKHPIALSYTLQTAEDDIKKLGAKADFYVKPLLKFIDSVEPDTNRMTHMHLMASKATTLLMDMGTPQAVSGVRNILGRRYSATTRSAAAGLLRTKNKAACPIATKLLQSPYPELQTYGALTLGHFADPAASKYFTRVISNESGQTVTETTLAAWYILKINKQGAQYAKQLAKLVK